MTPFDVFYHEITTHTTKYFDMVKRVNKNRMLYQHYKEEVSKIKDISTTDNDVLFDKLTRETYMEKERKSNLNSAGRA